LDDYISGYFLLLRAVSLQHRPQFATQFATGCVAAAPPPICYGLCRCSTATNVVIGYFGYPGCEHTVANTLHYTHNGNTCHAVHFGPNLSNNNTNISSTKHPHIFKLVSYTNYACAHPFADLNLTHHSQHTNIIDPTPHINHHLISNLVSIRHAVGFSGSAHACFFPNATHHSQHISYWYGTSANEHDLLQHNRYYFYNILSSVTYPHSVIYLDSVTNPLQLLLVTSINTFHTSLLFFSP
jgi:hypothetical protein